jgi:hypothetical protein
MKRVILNLGLLLGMAALSTMELAAQENGDPRGCRLDGGYAATLTGRAPGFGEVNGVGVIDVDGTGKFTGNVGGFAIGGFSGQRFQTPVTGTYTVARDCSLTFTMIFVNLNNTKVEGQGTISGNGRKVHILVTSPDNVALTGVARKQ